jgi:hypothetical protein
MTHFQYLHFDSLDSTYNSDCFDATFYLSHPVKNLKNIFLNTVELPIGFYNIRSDNGTNQFTLTIGTTTKTATLTSANYTSCSDLCSDLTTAFASLFTSNLPTFSVSGNQVKITVSTSAILTVTQTTLSKILGFKASQTTTSSALSITGTKFYNLAYDSYIGMAISNLPVYNHENNYIFKIQLNGTEGQLVYSNSNSIMTQSCNLASKDYMVSYLNIRFYDRFGYQIISNNGIDYSFSLVFEFYQDEIN